MTRDNQKLQEPRRLGCASIRRSSKNQEDNNSFVVQRKAIKKLASDKGYDIPDAYIFEDDGVSAFKKKASKRNGLNKMKKAILENEVDAVFFYDFSRIDRKIYSFVSEFYYEVIAKKPNLKFFTTTQTDEWTPEDLNVKLQLIIANAESGEKSRRSIDSQEQDLKNNEYPGSRTPYGYKLKDKELIETAEASVVRLIFYMFSWGHGIKKIVNVLNEAEIPSPTKKKWNDSSVQHILNNQVYKGRQFNWRFQKHPDKDSLRIGSHKQLVPNVLYQITKANLALKKDKYNKLETPFTFSDLLKCSACGNYLKHRNTSTRKGHKHFEYRKYGCKTCNYQLDMEEVNKVLLNKIEGKLSMSLKLNHQQVRESLEHYYKQLSIKKESLEIKIQQILHNEKVVCQEDSKLYFIFKNATKNLSRQVAELDTSIKNIAAIQEQEEIQLFLKLFKKLRLNEFEQAEQRVLMLTFLKEIIITKENNKQFIADVIFKVNPIQALANATE